MTDNSEGSAYPNDVSSIATLERRDAPDSLANSDSHVSIGRTIEARIAAAEAANRAHGQRGRSWALPGRSPAVCWSGRARWLLAVDVALATDEGRRLCRSRHLSPVTARAIARGCADYADSGTGRHLTASNSTIAAHAAEKAGRTRPWSHDVVANTRRVLELLGLAVEIARGRYLTAEERLAAAVHHDCVQMRAASTWSLTLIRRWHTKSFLPRRGPTGSKTPRRCNSPKRALTRAKAPSGRSPRDRQGPRPLAAQIVTADLISRTHGLDNGRHLGSLVDVITEMVDYQRWTGRDLVTVLNLDARTNPRDWPTHIENPAAFLRHRLSRIADRLAGPSPSSIAAAHAERLRGEQLERRAAEETAADRKATPQQVSRHMAAIRAVLQGQRPSGSTSVEPRS